jgi:hypothetical protein
MAESKEKATEKATDKAEAQVAKAVAAETDRGLRGVEVDPTPNEHYTVAGVLAGKPTPETDEDQAAKVGSRRFYR